MKSAIVLILIAAVAPLFFAGCAGKDVADKPDDVTKYTYPDPEPDCSRCHKKEGWALYINYRLKGTRSEGIDGRLFHNGKEIKGKKIGEALDTSLGRMTWKGEIKDYGRNFHPFKPTGWFSGNPEHTRRFDPAKGDK